MDLSFMAAQVNPLSSFSSPVCLSVHNFFAPIMPLSWAWLLHKFILDTYDSSLFFASGEYLVVLTLPQC